MDESPAPSPEDPPFGHRDAPSRVDTAAERAGAGLAPVDVGDRSASRALRDSEALFRSIVTQAAAGVAHIELDGRITLANARFALIAGHATDALVGTSVFALVYPDDQGRNVDAFRRLAADGTPFEMEMRYLRGDGDVVWVSASVTAVLDAVARPTAAVAIVLDVSDRRHTEQALRESEERLRQARAAEQALETSRAELVQALVDNRRARAEAEAASHAKDRFLAILSHELRTPLTPVVMALHALERDSELPASLRGTVELIRRNVRAELTLIDDLLDVTRISSGKLEMSRAQTDMHEVVHAAADVCAGDFAAKRQRIGLALHATRHMVPGDAARLQQVVWNLLKNASKFTPNEGEIKVVSSNVDNRFVLIVADTGIGIASDALPAIFDAFAQEGPWVTSEFGGLGLGLAIAKATVEAHHGSLVAASGGRNQGATFTIELPLD